jgi:hypothetical protein
MTARKSLISYLMSAVIFLVSACPALAITYSLSASGTYTKGQQAEITINIDTEGAKVFQSYIGLSCDTQKSEYVSSVPGDAMTSIKDTNTLGAGKIVIDGYNTNGFKGTGVYAKSTLKVTADSASASELCNLWAPTCTPEGGTATPTPTGTLTPSPTSPPQVTKLPTSGSTVGTVFSGGLAVIFFIGALNLYLISKKTVFETHRTKKNWHKKKLS